MRAHSLLLHLATSTAVERVFSQGRQILHFTRNRLSPHSIRAIMCFGAWGRKNLVHMPEIVEAIRTERKRKHDVIELD
jgi:hAT family C-terminal dimerisation region